MASEQLAAQRLQRIRSDATSATESRSVAREVLFRPTMSTPTNWRLHTVERKAAAELEAESRVSMALAIELEQAKKQAADTVLALEAQLRSMEESLQSRVIDLRSVARISVQLQRELKLWGHQGHPRPRDTIGTAESAEAVGYPAGAADGVDGACDHGDQPSGSAVISLLERSLEVLRQNSLDALKTASSCAQLNEENLMVKLELTSCKSELESAHHNLRLLSVDISELRRDSDNCKMLSAELHRVREDRDRAGAMLDVARESSSRLSVELGDCRQELEQHRLLLASSESRFAVAMQELESSRIFSSEGSMAKRITEARDELHKSELELTDTKLALEAAMVSVASLNVELAEIKKQNEDRCNESIAYNAHIIELSSEVLAQANEISRMQSQAVDAGAEFVACQAKCAELGNRLEELERMRLKSNGELEELRLEIENRDSELALLRKRYTAVLAESDAQAVELDALRGVAAARDAELASCQAKCSQLLIELGVKTSELLQAQLQAETQLVGMRSTCESRDAELVLYRERFHAMSIAKLDAEQEVSRLRNAAECSLAEVTS